MFKGVLALKKKKYRDENTRNKINVNKLTYLAKPTHLLEPEVSLKILVDITFPYDAKICCNC